MTTESNSWKVVEVPESDSAALPGERVSSNMILSGYDESIRADAVVAVDSAHALLVQNLRLHVAELVGHASGRVYD
jgi:hypothetical protein